MKWFTGIKYRDVHVHVILLKLGKLLALRLLFKVPRNTKYKKQQWDLGWVGESKIDDEVHVASEINLVNSKQT